mmetsp:Transcript_13460/g.28554  ORF Transcript_13460/g.28554 Transcript_13460/m.28554 type:complete len:202 (+) Transcript_13460:102-707(+)|eukprot:CAMPEP_0183729638 /NCGR_PEP_ID=MMETSP0737-20130205/30804_1 /TAXON_ID=385413 /ORGANISM="Thalassiosira miniscula, Strain CCMP1093" /LENGTH=201 /DNA_ID=CAMNT_0025961877 /DNA_START=46 /DNA_END=651 /DNA_ORIENTATION=+
MADTVRFNVGGRHFEVSRALVDEHSNTVLGKLVSDTWNGDPAKAVFIDRSGDIFAHILEYIRYGSIELPITVPRSMFDRELDYYGITSVKTRISGQNFLPNIIGSFELQVIEAKKELAEAEMRRKLVTLALEWNHFVCQKILEHPTLDKVCVINTMNQTVQGLNKKFLDNFLGQHFGLMIAFPAANCAIKPGCSVDVIPKK